MRYLPNILVLMLASLYLFSCANNAAIENGKTTNGGTDYSLYTNLSFTADSVGFPYNYADKKLSYYNFQVYGDTLYFYNQTDKEILFFSLADHTYITTLKLSHLILDSIAAGAIDNVQLLTSDSILVVQDFRLAIINAKGEVLQAWPTDKSNENVEYGHGQWYGSYPVIYKPDGRVFIHRFHATCASDMAQCPNYSIEAVFDLNNLTFDTLPIRYSQLYKTRNYSQVNSIARVEIGNKHIFSFESDPNLHVLNLDDNSVTLIPAQSKYHTADTLFFDHDRELEMQEIIDHYMQAPQYVGLWYDPYQKLVFRFFKAQQPLTNEHDEFNGIADKDIYLMVFDLDLNLLGEIHLGNSYSPWAVVTPNGLLVSRMSPNNPVHDKSHLLFDQIKLNQGI